MSTDSSEGSCGSGEATRIVAIRHGETAWNAESRIQGQLDIGLNERGRWQADRTAQALADQPFDAIYASDLSRAFETASALAAVVGLGVVADAGLRERGFGCFEGRTYREIEERWPEEALRWRRRDPEFGAEGGEVLHDFYARAVSTVTRLASHHAGGMIAVVAHGGVLDCLYRAAVRIELQAPRTWQLGNAGINRLLYTAGGLTMIGWSDTHHLDAAGADDGSDGALAR